jgi:hypothetical protein
MKQIKVTIDENGQATVEADGFKGKQCDVASAIGDAIGSTKSKKLKQEYHQQVQQSQHIGGRNG